MGGPNMQLVLVGLLVLDMCCVVMEFILGHEGSKDGKHPSGPALVGLDDATGEMLEGLFSLLSKAVLVFFEIEVLTLMWAMGCEEFFSSPGEVLDLIVVTFSLIGDLFLEGVASLMLVMR